MTARIAPAPSIDPSLLAAAELAAGGQIRPEANVYRTLATHPDLMLAWLSWGGHVTRRSSLSAELRELVILRTALISRGRYPRVQHVRIGRQVGIDDKALGRLAKGPRTAGWDETSEAALTAVDQVHHHGRLDDRCFGELKQSVGIEGTFDVLATKAFYRMASWMLNACRTPLDDGQDDVDLGAPERDRDLGTEATTAPRIEPLPPEEWPMSLLAETAAWPRFRGRTELRRAGVYGTLANHPALFAALGPMMSHLLVDNRLTDRQREIVIVRSCLHDRGAYPYRQHVRIASEAGVDAATLAQLARPHPELGDLTDAVITTAIDELHATDNIADPTWDSLAAHLAPEAIMDMIATAGFYGLISSLLNASRTSLEPGDVLLPARPFDK